MKKTPLWLVVMFCAVVLAGCGSKTSASSGDKGNVKTESTDNGNDKGKDKNTTGTVSLKQNKDGLYEINSEEEFIAYRALLEEDMKEGGKSSTRAKSGLGGILMTDIDLSEYCSESDPFYPIGYNIEVSGGNMDKHGLFAGTFDGNGHSISGIICVNAEQDSDAALFACVTNERERLGEIKNLTIKNSRFEATAYASAITAQIEGASVFSNIIVDESVDIKGTYACGIAANSEGGGQFENCVNYADVEGSGYACGIAQTARTASLCSNYGEITSERQAAGIIGAFDGSLSDCGNYGAVSATGPEGFAAGIYIANNRGTSVKLVTCINEGDVSAPDGRAGAMSTSTSILENCSNTGEITGKAVQEMEEK